MSEFDELMDAASRGDSAQVEALLDSDPELILWRRGGPSPLLKAIYHGHPETAQLFVARGAETDLFEAAAVGDLERVRHLAESDKASISSFDLDGYPPLGLAIYFEHPEVARFLIEAGADVNASARNSQKVAPIHAAAARGNLEMARLLLEKGADPNARQNSDFTALHAAALQGNRPFVELLLAHGADPSLRSTDGKRAADLARESGQEQLAVLLES